MPSIATVPVRPSLLCFLGGIFLPLTRLAAQQPERYAVSGDEVAIYNLAGEIRVEPGPGPDVTAEVTRETFRELRGATLQVLYDAVGAVSLHLTMTRHEQKASDEVLENIAALSAEL